jgi:hypothetical protein
MRYLLAGILIALLLSNTIMMAFFPELFFGRIVPIFLEPGPIF